MAQYNFFPELDYYFYNYWIYNAAITLDNISFPVIEEKYVFSKGSFLELLFNNAYSEDEYVYNFKEVSVTIFSKPIYERIQYSTTIIKPYIFDDSTNGENIFNLGADDLLLLDTLLIYRTTGSCDISSFIYNDLSTRLSKLIYVYLDLMLNFNFEPFNEDFLISDTTSNLDNLFELYVVNECYKILRSWSAIIDSSIIELRPVREIFNVSRISVSEHQQYHDSTSDEFPETDIRYDNYYDSTDLQVSKCFDSTADLFNFLDSTSGIPEPETDPLIINVVKEFKLKCYPIDEDLSVFHNGVIVEKDISYKMILRSYGTFINFDGLLDIKEHDVIIAEYYVPKDKYDLGENAVDDRNDILTGY